MEAQKKILILGIGNLLLKDEGVGVHVVERMKDMALPPDVEVMDGGTMGFNLLYYLEGREKVIVIDAAKAGSPPGTLYRFTDKDLADKRGFFRTAHDFDFVDALKTARFLGHKPEVIIIGVEPEDMSDGLELSPVIKEKIPRIIELVMKEIC
ncbi:MAG: HyaD/HybD family hydrogenase maturation endopeptidase [Nitrospirota bacterium]